MKNVKIIATGSYIPERIISNFDIQNVVDTSNEWIITRTGIKERRIAGKDETTSFMASVSAKRALEKANISPLDIDLIIVGTSTPDMFFPSTGCFVQKEIGAVNAVAFDIMAACSGFIYALHNAWNLVKSGSYNNALVIGAEKMSVILDWQDKSTCILFGDGAGTCIISKTEEGPGIIETDIFSCGEKADLLTLPAVGKNYINDFKLNEQNKQYIKMNGREVFKFAISHMQQSIDRVLSKAKIKQEQVNIFIPHQANVRIIDALAKKLNLDTDKVFVNVDKYGNMASASVPVALDEAVKQKKIKEGDIILLTTFGGGLTCGSCVLKW